MLMRFFLGTHEPAWLERTRVPLFISRRRLARRVRLPVAIGTWALDSGGFTELSMFGRWQTEPARYADEVASYRDRIGGLAWAAVQDWMCEPFILAKTGKTIAEHQARTIASYLDLKALDPSAPWTPVLQGWKLDDYLSHAEQYAAAGIDLPSLPVVGVGSVCRRQATREAADILAALRQFGIRPHGFGLKAAGLARCAAALESADSLAWSFRARRSPPLAGCQHKSCANCRRYALRWHGRILATIAAPRQTLFTFGA